MTERIRVGIVGARAGQGSWGSRAHIPALKVLGDYELKAICTAHEETAAVAAQEYGSELAFHDFRTMAAHPEVDLVVVAVNKAYHHEIVMAAIEAGKDVLCEWPLGTDFEEAKDMHSAANAKGIRSMIGLQGRSDPTVLYIRDLIAEGWIGEVIAANLTVIGSGVLERSAARLTANAFLIGGGHNTDILAFLLGEFADVSATVSTRVPQVKVVETGEMRPMTFPDEALFSGTLESGAVAQVTIASVPYNSPPSKIEIYGREGTLILTGQALHTGPNTLRGSQGKEPLVEISVPDRYYLMPEGTPKGPAFNVGQAYTRYADGLESGKSVVPDFNVALGRHRLLEAIQRSSDGARRMRLSEVT